MNWKRLLILLFVRVYAVTAVVSITEPTLIEILPINSTALTIRWQFADPSFDQSDFIRISIRIQEFFYDYNQTYPSIDYLFTPLNKTTTSLTKSFPLVNAFYYVCFSSNSTTINGSDFVFNEKCLLRQTCLRATTSPCPSNTNPFTQIIPSEISENSFLILVQWRQRLPYRRNQMTVQLINNSLTGTMLSSVENETFISFPYRFLNLQSNQLYRVNVTTAYSFSNSFFTASETISVTTSPSSTIFRTGDVNRYVLSCFVFLISLTCSSR